jgi:LuxR family maltose regulon positive regulatory protein
MTMLKYPVKLPPDTCGYILAISEGLAPDAQEKGNNSILLFKTLFEPRMYLGMGRYREAEERSFEAIREFAQAGTPISFYLLYIAYTNLAYLDMYTCTASHEYKSPQYLGKAAEYLGRAVVPRAKLEGPFGVADVRSFACLVGEGAKHAEFDQFLESARQSATHIAETSLDMYWGYDDLVACELAFFRNQLDDAGRHAGNAILKAREKKQHSIEAMAQQYLLRIAMHEGDYPMCSEVLKQLRAHLDDPGFWNRQLLHDLFMGSFYIHIGLPDMAAAWLAIDEKDTGTEVHIPTRELIVGVRYYIAKGKYQQALAILSNSYPRAPQERFHFGELVLSLLLAAVQFKIGETAGAASSFQKAYEMSFGGEFEMPFIEMGKLLSPLAAAVREHGDCIIPEQWLLAAERKASIYVKKTAVIANSFKRARKLSEAVSLSEREQEVLRDLYHGLSREEIAENRYLSINTVKSVLRSIFTKLDAYNNVDAIRIALEKNLL